MSRNNKPKPDDRSDNVEKIEFNIGKTIQNMELADEMIHKTDDERMKRALQEKNKRREEALTGMREEIRDEAKDKKTAIDKCTDYFDTQSSVYLQKIKDKPFHSRFVFYSAALFTSRGCSWNSRSSVLLKS